MKSLAVSATVVARIVISIYLAPVEAEASHHASGEESTRTQDLSRGSGVSRDAAFKPPPVSGTFSTNCRQLRDARRLSPQCWAEDIIC